MLRLLFVTLLLISSPAWGEQEWDLEVLDSGLPPTLMAGEQVTVNIVLENRCSEAWDPNDGFAIAAHWLLPGGEVVAWDGLRTQLPAVVAPGASVGVEAVLEVPWYRGSLLVQWDVVQEHKLWVSQHSPRPVKGAPVEIVQSHAFDLLKGDVSKWPIAGRQLTASLHIRNAGTTIWTVGEAFSVSPHWKRLGGREEIWEGLRTHFPKEVKPGETVMVEAIADVPDGCGQWLLEWDIVNEGVCWFSQRNGSRAPPSIVIVLPDWSETWPALLMAADTWPAVVMTLILALLAAGAGQRWWPGRMVGGFADLVWLVGLPLFVAQNLVPSGARGILVSAALLTALASLIALLPGKWRPWTAWAAGVSWLLMLVTDRIYLRFFSDLPSFGSAQAVNQADHLGESILSLFNAGDLLLLVTAGAGALVAVAVTLRPLPPTPFKKKMIIAITITCLASLLLAREARIPANKQIFHRVFLAQEVGIVTAHHLDLGAWIRRSVLVAPISAARKGEVETWFHDTALSRSGKGPHFGAASGFNLVMVQAESVQAFVVGLEVGGVEIMPTLNRWTREGLSFNRTTDQTGHGRSSDAELLTQVSLLPLPDGAAAFESAGNRFTSLASVLADRGYYTVSAVPFERSFWNRQNTHRAYGYDYGLFSEDFAPGEFVGWGLNDRSFLQQMGVRLADLPNPFCAWMITLSLHHPYEGFPDHLAVLNIGDWEGSPVGEYLHTMHLLDAALGDLESAVHAAGLAENTIIVVWGDHDAGFEWTAEVAALMGVSDDQSGWYDSQRVPLVLLAPDRLGLKGVIERPSGHIDVAPTVAALLGIDPAPLAWMGRNLLGSPGNEPVIGEFGCWTDEVNVFLQGDGTLGGGQCLDRMTLELEPEDSCQNAFDTAAQRIQISRTVLHHDLQEDLTTALSGQAP